MLFMGSATRRADAVAALLALIVTGFLPLTSVLIVHVSYGFAGLLSRVVRGYRLDWASSSPLSCARRPPAYGTKDAGGPDVPSRNNS